MVRVHAHGRDAIARGGKREQLHACTHRRAGRESRESEQGEGMRGGARQRLRFAQVLPTGYRIPCFTMPLMTQIAERLWADHTWMLESTSAVATM